MGGGMCLNLVKARHQVRAFDLNADAIAKVVEHGAIAAASIAEAVNGADAVVTMLPAGKHVKTVYLGDNGILSAAKPGCILLDCSTIAVEDARETAIAATEAGFLMVDAPVSGGTAAADAGTLTFMVGGTEDAFRAAASILEVMGQKIVHAGASGNGQVAKIANNMLLGISMIGTAEAFNLAESLGLDAQTFFDISSTASGQCWSMTSYCPAPGPVESAPSNREYRPGFAVDMMLKDLRLALEAANGADVENPLGKMAEQIYSALSANGHGGLDFSGVILSLKREL
jgi:3-hydroxyisobutyrate dehydrogenase